MSPTRFLMLAVLALCPLLVPPIAEGAEPAFNFALSTGAPRGYAAAFADNSLRLSGALTIEAWVRAPAAQPSTFPVILSKPVATRINGEANYAFIVVAATGDLVFRVRAHTETANATWTGNVLDDSWHHLAGVRTYGTFSDQLRLYVDGQLVATAPISGPDSTSGDSLFFGALSFPGFGDSHFRGLIDEVRIWNVARTQSEIQADRFRVFNFRPGLVAAWHFDHLFRFPPGSISYFHGGAHVAHPWLGPELVATGLPLSYGDGYVPVERRFGNVPWAKFWSPAVLASGLLASPWDDGTGLFRTRSRTSTSSTRAAAWVVSCSEASNWRREFPGRFSPWETLRSSC